MKTFFFLGWAGGIAVASLPISAHFVRFTNPALFCAAKLGVSDPAGTDKKNTDQKVGIFLGWAGGIRTPECQDQNLVPYHLATAQYCKHVLTSLT